MRADVNLGLSDSKALLVWEHQATSPLGWLGWAVSCTVIGASRAGDHGLLGLDRSVPPLTGQAKRAEKPELVS